MTPKYQVSFKYTDEFFKKISLALIKCWAKVKLVLLGPDTIKSLHLENSQTDSKVRTVRAPS